MKFYLTDSFEAERPKTDEYPCVTLFNDNWDDFTYKIQFYARLWKSRKALPIDLGSVKILQKDEEGSIAKATILPEEFTSLPTFYFCSLGQGRKYYEELSKYKLGTEILESLKDIVLNPQFADGFREESVFEKSMLRFSEAAANYETAIELFTSASEQDQQNISTSIQQKFTFTYKFEGFSSPHKVECDFTERVDLPFRIMAFVGKNGTGKTAVMAEMAKFLSGVNEKQLRKGVFSPSRPSFPRTIVVSYSPFGPFKYPPLQTSSYRYCGLFDEEEKPNFTYLENRIIKSIDEIFKDKNEIAWLEALETAGLFENEPVMKSIQGIKSSSRILNIWKRMSSGHYYICLLLTDIVSNLTKNSILLIDEPELYLHPNMVSGLMRSVEDLLSSEQFNSYAIVATHSPIVIQELLGKSVRFFLRLGNEPHCRTLDFESFGENLTTLVNQVFGVSREDKNYMRILEEISQGRTEDEVDELFDGKLSMNASSFVSAVIRENEKKSEKK
jgi:predicted ATPase